MAKTPYTPTPEERERRYVTQDDELEGIEIVDRSGRVRGRLVDIVAQDPGEAVEGSTPPAGTTPPPTP